MLENSKKSLLALSILAVLQGTALAQDENSPATKVTEKEVAKKDAEENVEEIDVITVVGTRGSLKRSLNAKRFADQVMDGISAEDIGKLPDNNIAEALSRVVGVSLDRSDGEGQFISIRGMDPSLSNVTVNGQGMASSSNGSEQGSGSRSVNLNNLGSEMVSAIEVFKSPTAKMIEGSIGGTVNLRSRSPIEVKNRAQVSVKGEYNDNADEYGDGVNLMANVVNDNEDFGANITISTFNRTTQRQGFTSRGWSAVSQEPYASTPGFTDALFATEEDSVRVIDDVRSFMNNDEKERINAAFKLQWLPMDDLDVNLNVLYAEQDTTRISHRSIYNFRNIGSKNNKYVPQADSIVIDDGNVVSQVVDAVDNTKHNYHSNSYDQFGEDKNLSVGLTVNYVLADNFDVTTAFGVSKAENNTTWITPTFKSTVNDIGYEIANGSWQPEIIYPDDPAEIAKLEPSAMQLTNLSWDDRTSEDTQEYVQVDFNLELDNEYVRSVEFGVRLNEQEKDWDNLRTDSKATIDNIQAEQGVVYFDEYAIYNQVNNMISEAPVDSWFVPDTKKLDKDFRSYQEFSTLYETPYNIVENTYAGYVQGNIDTELFNIPVRGNAGVRYVETQVDSSAWRNEAEVGTEWVWNTIEHDYDDLLPSLNLAFILSEEVIVRTAAAKVMSRPNHRQLASTFYVRNPGTVDQVVRVGNPKLSPYRANQYDLSAEWYFNENGILSAGLFIKDIKNFVIEVTEQRIIEGENDNWELLVKQPTNGEEAEVKGVEFSYQQAFTSLPAPFDGLGTMLNYTYNESDAVIPVEDANGELLETDLPGFSKNNANATIYYEKYGINVRLAYNYRSSYYQTLAFSGEPIFIDDYEQFDFTAGYRFNQNTSVSFNARNLTEEHQYKYVGESSRAFSAESNGRSYTLVLSHKF